MSSQANKELCRACEGLGHCLFEKEIQSIIDTVPNGAGFEKAAETHMEISQRRRLANPFCPRAYSDPSYSGRSKL